MNSKKLRIWFSVIVGGLAVLLFIIVFSFTRNSIAPFLPYLKMPEEFENPGVLIGTDFLSKEIFIQDSNLGTITDIAFGEFDSIPGQEIGIAGTRGALFVDDNRNIKSSALFKVPTQHVDIVDVEGDHTCEYLDRGGHWQPVSLINYDGKAIWTYNKFVGVDDITAGDIDEDGILEFVVGLNGDGGVCLLDRNSKERWKQSDSNVWHVELVDTDGNGSLEIVHSNACGIMTVRDAHGEIISCSEPAVYLDDFSITAWPTKHSKQYALQAGKKSIRVLDFNGKTIAKYSAPLSGCLGGHARGVSIKIDRLKSEFFAVIVELDVWNKSLLCIYGQDNLLVYQEIIPEICASIASIPSTIPDNEALLVGCNGIVWQYSLSYRNL